MSCYHPVSVGILRKSLYPGRRRRDEQTVPCGHCLGCRAEQARQWSVRIMHECQMHENAWFLTLTYSDQELPANGSLDPSHLREFFKAVRRDYPAGTVSYFACGEYGEGSERPHYHAVLFGVEFLDKCFLRYSGSSRVWRSESLESYWTRGISEFGTVTPASAAYVAGYVRKKVSRRWNPDVDLRVDDSTGELVEVEPEFARMSLKPAIGRRWMEKFWRDVYPADFVVVDGYEAKPPRYYDKWMDQDHEPDKQSIPCVDCREHQVIIMEVRASRLEAQEDLDRYTLDAKEAIHKARMSLFQKRDKV